MSTISKPYPVDFRRYVVAVARKHEVPLALIADFGISEATLRSWLRKADVEEEIAPALPMPRPPRSGF